MLKKDMLVGLSNNARILEQFISIMSEDELNRRIRDYWTIYEHIDHLVLTQRMLLGRIRQFIDEERPVMKPYTPDDKAKVEDANATAMDLVREFGKIRDRQLSLIKKAKKSVWSKEGKHEEYTKYSFEILLRHILLHDAFHMSRIEELWIKKEEYLMELNQS